MGKLAIAAIILQEHHHVNALSRKLTATETNDSNNEKEALAIVWRTGNL